MKNRILIIIAVLVIFISLSAIYYNSPVFRSSKNSLGSIDKNGIYAGEQSGFDVPSDDSDRFSRTVNNLNAGWDNIESGNSYFRSERYEEAAKAYKKAYDIDPGNRIFSGRKLIEAYEKLSWYDDALSVVDEILKFQPLGEYGIKKYTDIRNHLLAAKQGQPQAVST